MFSFPYFEFGKLVCIGHWDAQKICADWDMQKAYLFVLPLGVCFAYFSSYAVNCYVYWKNKPHSNSYSVLRSRLK